jgi:raffinose/stachyose/melibiose transport system substrate-binding protein
MRYKLLFLLILVAMVFSACAQATPEPTPVPPPAAEPPAAEPPPAEPAPTQPPAEPAPTQPPAAEPPPAQEQVTLTMGSWRVDDVAQINTILDAFSAQYPNITINFDPTNPPDYNAVLRTQLSGGTAPDLFYLRSFSTSRQLYNEGFLEPLEDLPGLSENFSEAAISPWATDDGLPYGVPFIAVSHGIYYNQDIFDELDLQIPETWEELLTVAQAVQDGGYTPFANASGDEWTIAEIVFMNLAPNFIGGREGRLEYLSGERCFNDENAVAAFQAVADIAPYLPAGQEALTYYDSQQLFLMGEAAMWFGGSWDIPFFESESPDFAWSVFAVPPPAGSQGHVTFHLDAGMGINAASPHKEEARLFLEWMTTPEFAAMLGNELPGFFPVRNNPPQLENEHANAFLALNEGRGQDVRWAWPVLLDGAPDGYTLMQNGAIAVLNGDMTPQQAADALQEGLAEWFEPAQTCQ